MQKRTKQFKRYFFWFLFAAGILLASIGFCSWLMGGFSPGGNELEFKISSKKRFQVFEGMPRIIPINYGDFELDLTLSVPRESIFDIVFRLETGPFQRSGKDDRSLGQGPLEWSFLRLSTGDMGKGFHTSRAIPRENKGIRIPADMPTDIHLEARGFEVTAEVGHSRVEDPGVAYCRRGIIGFVGRGEISSLRIRPLKSRLPIECLGSGMLMALLLFSFSGFLLKGIFKRKAWAGISLALTLATGGGLGLFGPFSFPKPRDEKHAPSFYRAYNLYGEKDAFRNWGAYAGCLYFRGRIENKKHEPGTRRVLVLGGEEVWGQGVELKEETFSLQAEGCGRLEGKKVVFMVGATRDTTLEKQLNIFIQDLLDYDPSCVFLFAPGRDNPRITPKLLALLGKANSLAKSRNIRFLVSPPLVCSESPRKLLEACSRLGIETWSPERFWFMNQLKYMHNGHLNSKAHYMLGIKFWNKVSSLLK